VPDERWFVDLVVAAAVGVGVYAATLIVVGLLPTERAALARLLRRRRAERDVEAAIDEDFSEP
jgi:hypothetical protein